MATTLILGTSEVPPAPRLHDRLRCNFSFKMFNLRIKANVEIATCLEPWPRLQPIASALSVKSLCTTTLTSAWELQRKNDSFGRNRRNRVTRSQEAKDKPSLSFVRSMACSSTRKEISPM